MCDVNADDEQHARDAGERSVSGATATPARNRAKHQDSGYEDPRRVRERGARQARTGHGIEARRKDGAADDPEREQRKTGEEQPVLREIERVERRELALEG